MIPAVETFDEVICIFTINDLNMTFAKRRQTAINVLIDVYGQFCIWISGLIEKNVLKISSKDIQNETEIINEQ